jgi:hypothetical protein
MQSGPDFRVGSTGYKISLVRVAPGKEASVAKRLAIAISNHTPSPPTCILKLFGRYDICAIYETKDFLDGPSRAGPIEGIRGGNKILAFHWQPSDEPKGLSVRRFNGSVWALSFFRFNETLLKMAGATMELLLARALRKAAGKNAAIDVLGTTGWAEIIFLIRARTFKDAADTLSNISKQAVFYRASRTDHHLIIPAKTFSLVGIDFDLTAGNQRATLKSRLDEPLQQPNGMRPHLAVTCPPAAMGAVQQYAKARFESCVVTLGATDFLLTPKEGTWGDFLAAVLDLRTSLEGKIYSTSIGLSVLESPGSKLQDEPFQMPVRRGLTMPAVLRKRRSKWNAAIERRLGTKASKWDTSIEHRLRSLYFALSNLLQDPLIGSCFDDLRQMAEKRIPPLLRELNPQVEEEKLLLDSLVEALAYAAQERAHGAFLAIEHLEGSLSPTKGGIQRILLAADTVPRKLLARAGKNWDGFIIAGFSSQHFSCHYEAINLPFEYLFNPEEWCGLFHEAGHAFLFDRSFYDMEGPEMTAILETAADSQSDEAQQGHLSELAWEIGADMFGLYFGYGKDFDLNVLHSWPNLTRGGKYITTDHLSRFFLLFEFWKFLFTPGRDTFPSNIDLPSEIAEFRSRLESVLGLEIRITTAPRCFDEAADLFRHMAPAVESFYRRFRQLGPAKDIVAELGDPAIKAAVAAVMNGKVFQDRISAPDTFILALSKEKHHLRLSNRLAAIISLWHSATVTTKRGKL